MFTVEGPPIRLKSLPVVRRIEYLNTYLKSIDLGYTQEEVEAELAEIKRGFEREKIMAVGRGNPYRKGIERTTRLATYCKSLSQHLFYIVSVSSKLFLTERGASYLHSTENERRQLLCESFSKAYPHLGILVALLNEQADHTVTLPLQNKPPFRPLALQYGLDVGQVGFDTLRDLATGIGVVNWYYSGTGLDRRQHVYLTCTLVEAETAEYNIFYHGEGVKATSNKVELTDFKKVLWAHYLELIEGVPGSPIFYSALRERVCHTLGITDGFFDSTVSDLVEYDDDLLVVWSEGVLPYLQDSASMLKSLPPKTDYDNYIIYLKITRRS